jgi:Ni,Fe-hydrogenase I cytochrome b subunit
VAWHRVIAWLIIEFYYVHGPSKQISDFSIHNSVRNSRMMAANAEILKKRAQ